MGQGEVLIQRCRLRAITPYRQPLREALTVSRITCIGLDGISMPKQVGGRPGADGIAYRTSACDPTGDDASAHRSRMVPQPRSSALARRTRTDGLCVDILRGWMAGQGATLKSDQVMIEAAGFSHVDNLADGFDGAWLAFANVEGVSARVRGMDTQMVTTSEAGIPNFSALELVGAAGAPEDVREAIAALVATLDAVTPGLCAGPAAARALWYRASGAAPDAEADAIVDASLPRFLAPVRRSADMWRPMWRYLHSQSTNRWFVAETSSSQTLIANNGT